MNMNIKTKRIGSKILFWTSSSLLLAGIAITPAAEAPFSNFIAYVVGMFTLGGIAYLTGKRTGQFDD